ncbi:MAG: hypothetical protein LBR78_03225 [Holosporales bacterium]|nr:hypothetical protein [Holosporales bacterium]
MRTTKLILMAIASIMEINTARSTEALVSQMQSIAELVNATAQHTLLCTPEPPNGEIAKRTSDLNLRRPHRCIAGAEGGADSWPLPNSSAARPANAQ